MVSSDENSRQAVLNAAVAAFARRGYAGTSVQDILRATGLSKPTLYYYFQSKAGLFRSILDFAYDECHRLMRAAAVANGAVEPRLVGVAAAIFQFAEEHQNLMRLVFTTIFASPDEIPAGTVDPRKRRRNFELVRGIVRAAQDAGELERRWDSGEVTNGILGAISHQVRMHLLTPKGRLNRARATRLVALFLNGARPRK